MEQIKKPHSVSFDINSHNRDIDENSSFYCSIDGLWDGYDDFLNSYCRLCDNCLYFDIDFHCCVLTDYCVYLLIRHGKEDDK